MTEDEKKLAEGASSPGTAIITTEAEAADLVGRISGNRPNTGLFWCVSCGFAEHPEWQRGLSLEFPEGELAGLGGDVYNYTGPCKECGCQTLVRYDSLAGDKSLDAMEREYALEAARMNARVLVDTVKDEFMSMGMSPSSAQKAGSEQSGPLSDLPDADDVDVEGFRR